MITNERITTYLHSLEKDDPDFLEEMRVYAGENDVPIIRREMESFICVLLNIIKPEKILEIGCGIAYSAIFMALNCDAQITTIENYSKRIDIAKQNIEKYINIKACKEEKQIKIKDDKNTDPADEIKKEMSLCKKINLIEADAKEVIKGLDPEYDFIFLDAAKAQYIEMLPDILRIMKPSAVLMADNVLQDGDIIDSRFITERRQRTIHERMREFLYEIKHNDMLDTSIITIGDGVSLSVKK